MGYTKYRFTNPPSSTYELTVIADNGSEQPVSANTYYTLPSSNILLRASMYGQQRVDIEFSK